MPPVVLVDSVVVIGAALEYDEHHEEGLEIIQSIEDGTLPPAILHDYVYVEVVNHLTRKLQNNPEKLRDIIRRIDSANNIRIYRVKDKHFTRSREEIYYKYNRLSLADSISVCFMEETGIDYLYSFDDGFDMVDSVTRLNSAISPY